MIELYIILNFGTSKFIHRDEENIVLREAKGELVGQMVRRSALKNKSLEFELSFNQYLMY